MDTPDISTPTIIRIPLNRVITFAGPQISAAAGFVATWIISALHVTAIPHDSLARGIANVVVFALTTILTWRGLAGWLKGHHIQLNALTPNVVQNTGTTTTITTASGVLSSASDPVDDDEDEVGDVPDAPVVDGSS